MMGTDDLIKQTIQQQKQQQQQQPFMSSTVPDNGNVIIASSTVLQSAATVPREPKTSTSHPINISWIVPPDVLSYLSVTPEFPDGFDLSDFLNPTIREAQLHLTLKQQEQISNNQNNAKGNVCLSSCPGKKVRLDGPVRGRAAISRDLDLDFARMKGFGITMLVCCLGNNELEFLGASWPKYEKAAKMQDMQILRLPMIEGGCPRTLAEVRETIQKANQVIDKGENVLIHCRGGVGRAGLFVGCWLLENRLCKSAEKAIYVLRMQRSPKAIETVTQVEYLIRYSMVLNKKLGAEYKQQKQIMEPINITENGVPSMPLIVNLENDINLNSVMVDEDVPLIKRSNPQYVEEDNGISWRSW